MVGLQSHRFSLAVVPKLQHHRIAQRIGHRTPGEKHQKNLPRGEIASRGGNVFGGGVVTTAPPGRESNTPENLTPGGNRVSGGATFSGGGSSQQLPPGGIKDFMFVGRKGLGGGANHGGETGVYGRCCSIVSTDPLNHQGARSLKWNRLWC